MSEPATTTVPVSRSIQDKMIVFQIEHEGRTFVVSFDALVPAPEGKMQRAARGAFARATGLPAESFVFPS